MALLRCSSGSGGGGSLSLKDFYYDKVFNGGFSVNYNITGVSGRATVSEGKISIDTSGKVGYIYLDVTALTTNSNPYANCNIQTINSTYLPRNSSGNVLSVVPLVTDSSSDALDTWHILYGSTCYMELVKSTVANRHYIVYGMWSYQ